jgi:hypothetical protein
MKTVLLFFIAAFFTVEAQSQTYTPGNYNDNSFSSGLARTFSFSDSLSKKKWSLNKYSAISTSFIGWKGGSATAISVPIGLQLTRRLNNNLYAFAGVSVAPSYNNFNQFFLNNNKTLQANSFMYRPNSFGINSRAELGLMYTNDEHTFQISGSFGVERRQFPQLGDFQQPLRDNRQPFVR